MVSQQLNNLTRLITIIIFLGLAGLAGSHLLGIVPSVQAAEMGPQAVISPGLAKPQAITNSVKMVSDSLVRPGEMVTYTIMVTTASPNPVINVEDRLPSELELVPDSLMVTGGVLFPPDTSRIIKWGPTINTTTPATMSYQAILTRSVVGGQVIENIVTIKEEDSNLSITKTATITVQQANLVMSKTVWPAHEVVQPNDRLTYTIIITNIGNDLATDVQVWDELPATLMGESLVTTTTITAGASITFTIPVTVRNMQTESWTISNTAFYSYTTSYTTGSGQQSVELQVGKPNLSISKQVILPPGSLKPGLDNITYTIVMTNNGEVAAYNLLLVDQLPNGIVPVKKLLNDSTITNNPELTITLSANETSTITLVGLVTLAVPEGQPITNTASYTHDVAYDYPTKTGNASADFMIGTPGTPELTISKHVTVTQRPARLGDVVTYTITVANQGSAEATGVQIVDHLPAQLDGQSISPTMTITAGESVILPLLTATVTDSLTELITITNTAFLTHSSAILTATSSFTVQPAPVATPVLTISKSVALSNGEPARPGDVVTYIITVTNQGSADATGVQIVDNLPAQLNGEPVSQTMTITAEQSVSLILTATVTQNLPIELITISNTATLTYGSDIQSATVSFTAKKPSPIYLPLIIKQPEPENTPTPSPTAMSTQTPTPPPPTVRQFANPGFEQGRQSWQESSSNNLELIVPESELNDPVTPHSGNYAVWLGGENDERADLSQAITIPAGFSTQYPLYLGFWYWIGSSDSCGNDEGYVAVGSNRLVTFDLCAPNDTRGWKFKSVRMTQYAGQQITVSFSVRLNDSGLSSLLLDDVYFQRDGSRPASAGRTTPPVKDGPGTVLTR